MKKKDIKLKKGKKIITLNLLYFEEKDNKWQAIGNVELVSTAPASPMSPVYDFVSPKDKSPLISLKFMSL